ncbi:MAG: hypothetical protein ACOCRO_04955 [Halanaerobiales bacterium]
MTHFLVFLLPPIFMIILNPKFKKYSIFDKKLIIYLVIYSISIVAEIIVYRSHISIFENRWYIIIIYGLAGLVLGTLIYMLEIIIIYYLSQITKKLNKNDEQENRSKMFNDFNFDFKNIPFLV